MDEDLEKRAIEAMPVVRSLRCHAADAKNKADYHVNLRCGCGTKQEGANVPLLVTAYVNLDDGSSRITAPPASLQRKSCKLLKKMLQMRPQNVLIQQKPRPGKDGFLLHTRLGLVGCILHK